jgi:TetR/AcrR family transcriptional repressor of nem operon
MSKREEIIQTAKRVIHSKGYQATAINDILQAASIGKGQFYHYFSSKHDLGLTVVEQLTREWEERLIVNILEGGDSAVVKLTKMLDSVLSYHEQVEGNPGCPMGNLAVEMSEHDEQFRLVLHTFFERWVTALDGVLTGLSDETGFQPIVNYRAHAQSIVAQIEGAILLMKAGTDFSVLVNVITVIRHHLQLAG